MEFALAGARGARQAEVVSRPGAGRSSLDVVTDEFEKAGYTVNSAYTVVKNPETTKFIYRDSLWSGADLLSAGVASFGELGGVHYQNQADVAPYMTELDEGRLPIFRH